MERRLVMGVGPAAGVVELDATLAPTLADELCALLGPGGPVAPEVAVDATVAPDPDFDDVVRVTGSAPGWRAVGCHHVDDVVRAVVDAVEAAVADRCGVPLVHAASVSFRPIGADPAAVLLVGASRAGKTTLALACCAAGATYLTDELTLVLDPRHVLPLPRPAHVRPGGPALDVPAERTAGGAVELVVPRRRSAAPRRAAAVVLLDRREVPPHGGDAAGGERPPVSVQPVPVAVAVRALVEQGYNLARLGRAGLEQLLAFASAVPTLRLTYCRATDAADLLLHAVPEWAHAPRRGVVLGPLPVAGASTSAWVADDSAVVTDADHTWVAAVVPAPPVRDGRVQLGVDVRDELLALRRSGGGPVAATG